MADTTVRDRADKAVRPDKADAVSALATDFRDSSATVLTEYRGLTMAQLTELRRSLGRETSYTVAKNTLAKLAARDAGLSDLDELLVGPTALAFVKGDPVEAAKGLRDFARTHPMLVIKGGVLDGRTLSAEEVSKLADLESREVLLAKLAGALKAKTSQAAATLIALPTQLARLAAALQEKKAADGGASSDTASDTSDTASDTADTASDTADTASDTADTASDTADASAASSEA